VALTHFLAFLPEKMSSNGEKTRLHGSINAKMMKNDVTTGFASEMFVVVLSTSSKAATVIMANAKNYLTNHIHDSFFT
jgi:hypothetical protein